MSKFRRVLKTYTVGKAMSYSAWLADKYTTIREVYDMEKADLVVFTGGADVNPKFYKEKLHPQSTINQSRDTVELRAFEDAVKMGKKVLGICRGLLSGSVA